MPNRWIPVLVTSLVLFAATARAQEAGRTGVTFGYPPTIGLVWHPSASLALRPEFSFSGMTGESSGTNVAAGTTDTTSFGLGASALFYVKGWDDLNAYLAPRFSYSRTSSTSRSSSPLLAGNAVNEGRGNAYSANGLVGLQYSLSRRFGVFGETGFGYTYRTTNYTYTYSGSSSGAASSASTQHSWGMVSAIGAIFYF